MKTQVSYLLLLCFSLFLTSVSAADTKSPVKAKSKVAVKVKPAVSCVGVPPFFYGLTYFPGQRVVFNGNLYQAISTNTAQFPGGGPFWVWFGPCN